MGVFAQKAAEAAGNNFKRSINCAETLVKTFDDLCSLGIGKDVRLATGFGAGMGQAGDLCGALAGAVMVLGAFKGRPNPPEGERKDIYPLSKEFHARFMAVNNATDCDDLRNFDFGAREQNINCLKLVVSTADLLGQFLVDKGLAEDK